MNNNFLEKSWGIKTEFLNIWTSKTPIKFSFFLNYNLYTIFEYIIEHLHP